MAGRPECAVDEPSSSSSSSPPSSTLPSSHTATADTVAAAAPSAPSSLSISNMTTKDTVTTEAASIDQGPEQQRKGPGGGGGPSPTAAGGTGFYDHNDNNDNETVSLSTSTNDSSTIPSPDNMFYVASTPASTSTPTGMTGTTTIATAVGTAAPTASSKTVRSSFLPVEEGSLVGVGQSDNNNNNTTVGGGPIVETSTSFGMDLDSSDGSNNDHGDDDDDGGDTLAVAAASATAAAALTTTITTTTRTAAGHDFPDEFHQSPEPLNPPAVMRRIRTTTTTTSSGDRIVNDQLDEQQQQLEGSETSQDSHHHRYHMLGQIKEDRASTGNSTIEDYDGFEDDRGRASSPPLASGAAAAAAAASERNGSSQSPIRSPIGSPLRRTSGFSVGTTGAHYASSPSLSSHTATDDFHHQQHQQQQQYFVPQYTCTRIAYWISKRVFHHEDFAVATWLGFWALLNVTCANYVLSPMRDAVALQVGVQHIPKLTLASSLLAFLSSVPIGWLFEAPEPSRRKVWKKMGLTRGETQGTSLALFYRVFAVLVLSYAVGFRVVDLIQNGKLDWILPSTWFNDTTAAATATTEEEDVAATTIAENDSDVGTSSSALFVVLWNSIPYFLSQLGSFMSVTFFLVIHLMKLHSISLVWGVTTEAMEYEDVARKQQQLGRRVGSTDSLSSLQHHQPNPSSTDTAPTNSKKRTRLQRLALVGFGGTLGGVWGSFLASSMAKYLGMSGLLIISAYLLEVSAELSIELGRIMQKHWQEQQIFQSTQDLTSLDPSMRRSASVGSMKRVASGNSMYAIQQQHMKRVASGNSLARSASSSKSLVDMGTEGQQNTSTDDTGTPMSKGGTSSVPTTIPAETQPDDTFTQRLLRGITTILKSRLLMAIFTYNALFASTSVLLSFQRAELVANRNQEGTTVSADTAFLANINMASSIAVFAMQASGIGAVIAHQCGSRGSLALMPLIRLLGIGGLCWWHRWTNGRPPNLILFLMLDECTRVINLAVAKPVRESLWRGLSNEARYEAKPIVDTLANRWGAGSASFCVSVVSRVLLFLGQKDRRAPNGDPIVLGLPPILFLGFIVAAWWLGVSFDLGHIRRRIDLELKKRQ